MKDGEISSFIGQNNTKSKPIGQSRLWDQNCKLTKLSMVKLIITRTIKVMIC